MQKTDFMNVVSRFEYTVNMMCREEILTHFIHTLRVSFDLCLCLFVNNPKKKKVIRNSSLLNSSSLQGTRAW